MLGQMASLIRGPQGLVTGRVARPSLLSPPKALFSNAQRFAVSSSSSSAVMAPRRASGFVAPKSVSRKTLRVESSAAGVAKPPAEAPFKWGANMKDLGICVAAATVMWFIPPPAGVTLQAWHLLAVFVGTIVGIITTPLPLGAVALLGLGAAQLTKVLTFSEAFSAFSTEIP